MKLTIRRVYNVTVHYDGHATDSPETMLANARPAINEAVLRATADPESDDIALEEIDAIE